jgi:multiple sugar transport system permease protein
MASSRTAAPSPAPHLQSSLQRVLRQLWHDRWIYLFLAPTAVLFTLFTIWPILASYWYSLLNWNGFERQGTFIGLANYAEVVRDPWFWNSFMNTFLFMFVTLPIRVGLAFVAAVILNDKRLPFANLFRTMLFLPVVTTMAIIGVVMVFVFDPAGGPMNLALSRLGLIDRPVDFLGRSSTALYTAMGVHIWKWFGITLIYWLASLQTVPEELYEAAQVDGANARQMFWYITVPMLIPFAIIIVLITALDTLRVFDLILTLTGGGPAFRTEVVEVYIYRWAFAATIPRLGYASAAAVFFGIATLALALGQAAGLRYAQRMRSTQ